MKLLAGALEKEIHIRSVLKITNTIEPFIFIKRLEDIFPKDEEFENLEAALGFENLDIKLPDETYDIEYVVLDVQASKDQKEMLNAKIIDKFPDLNIELYGLISHNICKARYKGNLIIRALFDIKGPHVANEVEVDLDENSTKLCYESSNC